MQTKIYILSDETGNLRYVGKTSHSLSKRLNEHLSRARRGSKSHLRNWIRSVLSRGFIPKITLIGEIEGDGSKEEIAWIRYFRDEGVNLCNATDGGGGSLGYKPTPETRAKTSAFMKGKNFHKGYRPTAETKAKTSATLRGRKFSTEHRSKLSASATGRQHTPESRAKMSSNMARKLSMMGRRHSPETIRKMSEARKKWYASQRTVQL